MKESGQELKGDFEKLKEIVAKLDNADLDLDESLRYFEEGAELAKKCFGKLKEAKNRFEKIKISMEENSLKD